MTIKRAVLSAAPLLFAAAFLSPALALAAMVTATQTVTNVAVGANDDQTDVTTLTQANVAQIKATRTLTVNSLPAASSTSTVGSCVITYSTGSSDSLNCSGNAAVINITTHNSTTTIAATLGALTSVSDSVNGHGALTATSSGFTATFTTTGAEASSTVIRFIDGTSGAITSTGPTAGQVPVTQINTVTIGGTPEAGDIYTVTLPTVGAVSYTATTSDDTTAKIANGLKIAVLASAGYGAQHFTAATSTNTVVFTATSAGTGFTQTSSAANYPGVAQQVTFTPDTAEEGDYAIEINGTQYKYSAASTDTLSSILIGLTAAMASPAVSCSQDGTKVTCVATVPGTSFTYAGVFGAYSSGNSGSHHSSGGGSSHSSSSSSSSSTGTSAGTSSSLQAQVAALTAQLAALGGQVAGNASASFTRDLDIGATGADVKALQVWLNAHGFVVATTGPGSKGQETMTFGGLTQAALAKWQASVGIMPSAGYFGPKTRAYLAAH